MFEKIWTAAGTSLLIDGRQSSFKYYLKAHVMGDHQATAILGLYFEFGLFGIHVCYKTAEKYLLYLPISFTDYQRLYLKAACAHNGIAFSRLAFLRTHGRVGVIINLKEAEAYKRACTLSNLDWIRVTARSGLGVSQLCMGLSLYNSIGFVANDKEAFKCFYNASENGIACAMNMLGNMYLEGYGCSKNPDQALEWYIKAAESRDGAAIYNIGSLYEHGISVVQSNEQAYEWYLRAALYGSVIAFNVLGIFNEKGLAGPINEIEAIKWYQKGAINGNPHAEYNIGRLHHEGNFCEKNDSLAYTYFERASHQNHTLASISCAISNEHGIGVNKNMKKAILHYQKAYSLGSHEARKRLIPIITFNMINASRVLFPNLKPHLQRIDSKYAEDVKELVYSTHSSQESNVFNASKSPPLLLHELPFEIRSLIFGFLNEQNIVSKKYARKMMMTSTLGIFTNSRQELWDMYGIQEKNMICDCHSDGPCALIYHHFINL